MLPETSEPPVSIPVTEIPENRPAPAATTRRLISSTIDQHGRGTMQGDLHLITTRLPGSPSGIATRG